MLIVELYQSSILGCDDIEPEIGIPDPGTTEPLELLSQIMLPPLGEGEFAAGWSFSASEELGVYVTLDKKMANLLLVKPTIYNHKTLVKRIYCTYFIFLVFTVSFNLQFKKNCRKIILP